MKLLWLDMEMTGLDVEKEVIIETACIVTRVTPEMKFEPLAQYHAIVCQPQEYLDRMDDWNQKHHSSSGLLAQIPGGKAPALVEEELCDLVRTHFGTEKAVLAGNSIGQDRLFINRYMKDLSALLHYRMLDVTSFKILFNAMFNLKFKKKEVHRALDDIQESIDELKFYLGFLDQSLIKNAVNPS